MIDRETATVKDRIRDGMDWCDYRIGEIVQLREDGRPFCGRLAMILAINAVMAGRDPIFQYSLMIDEKHGISARGARRIIPLPQTPEIKAAFQKQLEEAREKYRSGRK